MGFVSKSFVFCFFIFSLFCQTLEEWNEIDYGDLQLTTYFFESVKKSDFKKLELILQIMESYKVSIDVENDVYDSALIVAVRDRNIPMIKYLLKKGADINFRNSVTDVSPILQAAQSGFLEIVQFLIANGANVMEVDGDSSAEVEVVIYAIFGGHTHIIEYLLNKGIDVNSTDKKGVSFLMHAAYAGNANIFNYLLKKRASIKGKTAENQDISMYAAYGGNLNIIRYLRKKQISFDNIARLNPSF